jgi:hypothetical protein
VLSVPFPPELHRLGLGFAPWTTTRLEPVVTRTSSGTWPAPGAPQEAAVSTFLSLAQDQMVEAAAIPPAVPGALFVVLVSALVIAGKILKTVVSAAKAIIGPLLAVMAVLTIIAVVLVVSMFTNHDASKPTDPKVAEVVSPAVVLGG